ncbi:MAG: S8 family peptidase [Deltaproteobacteria bacterium]|nr:S8 family peptidase [Deltaproteobacteria bacterium]
MTWSTRIRRAAALAGSMTAILLLPIATQPQPSHTPTHPEPGRTHVSLQFKAPVSRQQHEALREAGVNLSSYRGNNAYFATLPRGSNRLIEAFDALQLVPAPVHKLAPELLAPELPSWTIDPDGRLSIVVEFYVDVSVKEARDILRRVDPDAVQSGTAIWNVVSERDALRSLAEQDAVKRIVPGPLPFLPLNETARWKSRSEDAQDANLTSPRPVFRVDGEPVVIGIFDNGIQQQHHDFDSVEISGAAGISRIDPQRTQAELHGTLVGSIAGGSGLNSETAQEPPFARRGHAPYAGLGDYRPISKLNPAAGALHDAIVDHAVDVTNHSYAQSMTVYDPRAVLLDSIVRGDEKSGGSPIPPRPQVWAAGNSGRNPSCWGNLCSVETGYFSVFTSAKNTISVGSIDTLDGRLSDYSSLGPTFDGRIKPDVVAPGCRSERDGIRAASVFDQDYWNLCGTSMAAPAVAGIVALVMHEYQKPPGVEPDLLPSTYKAILIQTAKDQIKEAPYASEEFDNPDTGAPVLFHEGPDFATGWGLVDAEAAREIMSLTNQWKESFIQFVGDREEWCMPVAPDSGPIRVTLAWDDLPGDSCGLGEDATCSQTSPRLVNDLDLELVLPDGTKKLPWRLDTLKAAANPVGGGNDPIQPADVISAKRGVDHLNNVERVDAMPQHEGMWRIAVQAHVLPMDSPQAYSLASSHPFNEGPCPPETEIGLEPKPETPDPTEETDRWWPWFWPWFRDDSDTPLRPSPADPVHETRSIDLPNRTLRPEPGVERELERQLEGATLESVPAIVQFQVNPSSDERARLARVGVELGSYLGARAYASEIRVGTDLGSVEPRMYWAGLYLPRDKISPQVWQRLTTPLSEVGATIGAVVHFGPEISPARADALLEAHGAKAMPYGHGPSRLIEIERGELQRLAGEDAVRWVGHVEDESLPLLN